jgi:integrase/recombinase XerD
MRTLALEPNRRNQLLLLKLLYYVVGRVSEIAALTGRDLQPRTDGGQMTVFGKGGKTRTVLLPSAIGRERQRFRQGAGLDAFLFGHFG